MIALEVGVKYSKNYKLAHETPSTTKNQGVLEGQLLILRYSRDILQPCVGLVRVLIF